MSLIFFMIFALFRFVIFKEEDKEPFWDFNTNNGISTNTNNNTNTNTNTNTNINTNTNSNSNTNINPNPNTNVNNSNSSKKRVAITYDDGPHNVNTVKIVDELAKYGFNATFFVVGNRIDGTEYNGAKTLKYVASKGNEIAIHGYSHLQNAEHYYDTCSDATFRSELGDTKSVILKHVPNANIKLMRPVGGRITNERIKSCEYSVVMWSVDSNDWRYKNSDEKGVEVIVDNVMSQVKNGSIILMHDIYENTYLATQKILKELNNQGYEVVTVSELLGNPLPSVKYSNA